MKKRPSEHWSLSRRSSDSSVPASFRSQDIMMPLRSDVIASEQKYTDEEAVDLINATFSPGVRLMHPRCISASNADASLVIEYDLDHRFVNGAGFLCGGYVANALDQTACFAMSFLTGEVSPTLEIKVSFIAAVRPGRLVVTGKVVKAGRSFGFVESVARNADGELIATASATVQQISMEKLTKGAKAAF